MLSMSSFHSSVQRPLLCTWLQAAAVRRFQEEGLGCLSSGWRVEKASVWAPEAWRRADSRDCTAQTTTSAYILELNI